MVINFKRIAQLRRKFGLIDSFEVLVDGKPCQLQTCFHELGHMFTLPSQLRKVAAGNLSATIAMMEGWRQRENEFCARAVQESCSEKLGLPVAGQWRDLSFADHVHLNRLKQKPWIEKISLHILSLYLYG